MTSVVSRLRPHPEALTSALVLFSPAIPFGFIVGLAAANAELPLVAGWLSAPLMFAGASQLAVITIAGATSWWAAIVAGLVINSRHVMYSLAMAPGAQAPATVDAVVCTPLSYRPGVRNDDAANRRRA
ncbi:MAG: AzlC family ABC transporter permease [Acidimicrobiales bacterium]